MVASSFIAGSLLGGLLDRETANATNEANLKLSDKNQKFALDRQESAQKALTGNVGDVYTSRTPEGGFKTDFGLDTSSALLKGGDFNRAKNVNALSEAGPNLLTEQLARNAVIGDQQQAQGQFDNAYNTAFLRANQAGSPGSTSTDRNKIGALGDVADKLRLNTNANTEQFMNTANTNRLKNFQAALNVHKPQAPDLEGVGPSASTPYTQIPIPGGTPDLSGATTSGVSSNFIKEIQKQAALEDSRAEQNKLFDRLIKSGAFNSGTKVKVTT